MTIFDFLDAHGIKYNNKDLINQAFVHSSYVNEHKEFKCNERLEFLGDAVFQIYSARKLYEIKPELKEGVMSPRRSRLVCEKALAQYVRDHNLNQFLLAGESGCHDNYKENDSIISDMLEAFVGAVYYDSDIDNAFKLIDIFMLKYLDEDVYKNLIDYKTRLQEFIQADKRQAAVYTLVDSKGPSNNPTFTMQVSIDGLVYGQGVGKTKKQAQEEAAKQALEKMCGIKDEI